MISALTKIIAKFDETNNEASTNFQDKIKTISEQFQISIYHLTMIYASLFKLYKSALRVTSFKQEVLRLNSLNCNTFINSV